MQKVIIEIKNVYGNQTIYPVNDIAANFARLTGKKTFSKSDLQVIETLGFVVEIQAPVIK